MPDLPPPWMSMTGPMSSRIMAEHSMCQPGRPRPHGLSHSGSPGFAAFQSAKSPGLRLRPSTPTRCPAEPASCRNRKNQNINILKSRKQRFEGFISKAWAAGRECGLRVRLHHLLLRCASWASMTSEPCRARSGADAHAAPPALWGC